MEDQNMGATVLAERDIVSFRLAERMYALPLSAVVQIIPMVAFTPLPQANAVVEGIMNYRGRAALIINLRRHLNLPPVPFKLHTPIILIQMESRLLGLIVDEVLDVTVVPALQVTPLADVVPEGLGSLSVIEGVIYNERDAILLMSLPRLFSGTSLNLLPDVVGNGPDLQPCPVAEMSIEEVV